MTTLETLAEATNFQSLILAASIPGTTSSSRIHIGASCNDPVTKKKWFWFKNGVAVAYTLPWGAGYPTTMDSSANCMAITVSGAKMFNILCYAINSLFSCQK